MFEKPYTNRRYLDALQEKILVFDGAMGTSLQKLNLTAADFGGEKSFGCIDYLALTKPQAVETVHRSFLDAGVDVIETCTFRANRITLGEYQLQDKTLEINRAAAILARRLADEYYQTSGQIRFVAGSMGPSGKLPSMNDPELSNVTFDDLSQVFREQAGGLIEGGVDLLVIETSQDILEVKAAIAGINAAFTDTGQVLPIQAQVTLDTTGRMLLGTDIRAVLTILEGSGVAAIGLNCSTGPDYMREPIRTLGELSTLPVSCIPNAGLPLNIDGQAVYPLEPEPFAKMLTEFVKNYHINIVGGCCGTTPTHLKLLVEQIRGLPANPRPKFAIPSLASAVQFMPMQQEPRPFLIGERLNTQGSRKFKQLILAEDFEGALEIAREQAESGAHGLDLCTALTERPDEASLMQRLIKTIAPVVRIPFVIDSTEPEVIETALKTAPGRCLINSTNLESGRAKADRIFSLARQYNAAVIALTIDEKGMARTAGRKLEIAQRIFDIAVADHHLLPHDLVFDALTFTLATGDPEFANSAIETIEGIRLIKTALPGVLTSLGVSNISFGLPPNARPVLNSIMLYHCVQAGLDMAIINPSQVTPYADIPEEERTLVEDLIFNRQPDALARLIAFYQQNGPSVRKQTARELTLEGLDIRQRLHHRILHRLRDGVEADIEAILTADPSGSRSQAALEILNDVLLPAMKEVGDKFGSGELILPFVLQSAEVMKKSVSYLEQFLERKEGTTKGTLVLATVYGDVHDIGKNLVKTILSNNGYQVVDLGKQVPAETIISKAVEIKADAIGLSALLVSTSKQMPLIVNELHRRSLSIPVLIGGAAINRRFGRRILKTEQGDYYEPGVFYCKDAFEGLSVMDNLSDPEKRAPFKSQNRREAEIELGRAFSPGSNSENNQGFRSVDPALKIPTPPFWGPRVVQEMPLELVFAHISKNELFRLSWGAKNAHGAEWEKLQSEFETRLSAMKRQALQEHWLKPQGVYGCWPAQSLGNELIVFEPGSIQAGDLVELTRFSFPRQPDGDRLCLSDYFSPLGSGIMDIVVFQVVTVGEGATRRIEELQVKNEYGEAYFSHGLAVQTAEATAEFLHQYIRQELGLATDQGKRYSWGYPAIPDLEDHSRVFQLLPAERELGMRLTPAYQLVPEQSTAAIIIHHPAARYFNIGENRITQLAR